ncbi:stage II sporulation protein R [Virgibacillus xinjiangensis]|uniref:Stage II sporulation protein R n=1 Tax=Virgibacillus xinjiangensis TaxID=393090 RepID=A0ABV7CT40_9BACI
MKKLVFFVFIFFIIFLSLPTQGVSEQIDEEVMEFQVIPDEAIRLRILANSDSEEDQELKRTIRDRVNKEITEWVEQMTDIEEARELIAERIPEVEKIVAKVLEEAGKEHSFEVEYGENISFPAKLYGNYLYPEGEYEAVLISIGEAEGANWWCVLFPPLCFLDFSNGTSVAAAEADEREADEQDLAEEEEETEVKFFLFEWLGWS